MTRMVWTGGNDFKNTNKQNGIINSGVSVRANVTTNKNKLITCVSVTEYDGNM